MRREPLKDTHRIVGAEKGNRGSEENSRGAAGDGRQQDFGRGDREVPSMMLADSEPVQAELIGEHRLLDDVTQHLRVRQHACRRDRA